MGEDRGTGKTTKIMEEAVSLAAELPEGSFVWVTGPHTNWLLNLGRDFIKEGLVGIKFITIPAILHGGLRGARGVLLVDDIQDVSDSISWVLYEESLILRR